MQLSFPTLPIRMALHPQAITNDFVLPAPQAHLVPAFPCQQPPPLVAPLTSGRVDADASLLRRSFRYFWRIK